MTRIKKMPDGFGNALDRVLSFTGLQSPSEFQDAISISRQAFSQAKNKDAVPSTWTAKLQKKYGLNPDWVTTGAGPKTMAELHLEMADVLYVMRNHSMDMMHQLSRYPKGSPEYGIMDQVYNLIDKLRHHLDERAFKECPDLDKNERIGIYYQGGDRSRPDSLREKIAATQSEPAGISAGEVETDPIIRRIREVERIYKGVDASTEEILEAVKLVLHTSAHPSRLETMKTSSPESVKAKMPKGIPAKKESMRKLRLNKKGPGPDDVMHYGLPEDVQGNDQPKD